MKIITSLLILSSAVLLFLPEGAWAPTDMYPFTGEISEISVRNDSIRGVPWAFDRRQNTGLNSPRNDSPDPDSDRGPGGPWW